LERADSKAFKQAAYALDRDSRNAVPARFCARNLIDDAKRVEDQRLVA
jgi:hypothetical protein